MNASPVLARLAALIACSAAPLGASLVYHLPFDIAGTASLANAGSAGGTGTANTGISGATAPSASQTQYAPGFGDTWSEYFPVTGPTDANNRGGSVVLPDSTGALRLNSTTSANQMTISTWVYWNGNAGGTITSPAGIAGSMNGSTNAGWSFRINSDGKLYFGWLNPAGNGRNRTTSSSVVTAGQWVNVALVFDSNNSLPASIYVNGVAAATVGSAGDATMGTMKADANSIAVGIGYHTNGQGRQSLNGYMDDFAIWDTALSAAQIRALNTVPTVLSGYDAGVINGLFTTYAAQATSVSGTTHWSYSIGFDVTGRTLGDTWLGTDGNYYLWLEGSGAEATGLSGSTSAIPEPSSTALLISLALTAPVALRRSVRRRR